MSEVTIKIVPVTVFHYFSDKTLMKCLQESLQPRQNENFPYIEISAVEIRCILSNLTKDFIYSECKSLHHILETFSLAKLEQTYNAVILDIPDAVGGLTRAPMVQFGIYRNRRLPLDAMVAGWFILTGMLQDQRYAEISYELGEVRSRLAKTIIGALSVVAGQAANNQPVRVIYNNLVVYTDTGLLGDRELRIVVDAEIYKRYQEEGYTDEQLIARLDREPDQYYVYNDYQKSNAS